MKSINWKSRALVFVVIFLAISTECHYSDMASLCGDCHINIKEFKTKEELADYLKSAYQIGMFCSGGPCVKAYEATVLDYDVTVKTEDRKKESTETVEV